MVPPTLLLAPGQRFCAAKIATWRADQQLTILQVGRNEGGDMWINYRVSGGPMMTAGARQIERAIATGEIVPVFGSGQIVHC
ncbi:MAG: hypothetical protein ACJ789_00810 [Thermomicrobiales bacterium]